MIRSSNRVRITAQLIAAPNDKHLWAKRFELDAPDVLALIVDLKTGGGGKRAAWLEVVQALAARKLGAPQLAVIDGNPGLAAALRLQWSALATQRCANHKLWNCTSISCAIGEAI